MTLYTIWEKLFGKNRYKGRHWKTYEYFEPYWKNRISFMANLLKPEDQTLIDMGCGPMWLKEILPSSILYRGLDYTARDSQTLVFDINKGEFPDVRVDVFFCSGILEYVHDLNWLVDRMSAYGNTVILSYTTLELYPSIPTRQKLGWANHYSRKEIMHIFEKQGFVLETPEGMAVDGNEIMRWKK